MKILMISSTFPYPPTGGGTQVRTFNLLQYLSQRHSITVATQGSAEVTAAEIAALGQVVDELKVFPRPGTEAIPGGVWGKVSRFGQFLTAGTPPSVLSIYSPEMQQWINQQVQSGTYSAITCEHSVNEIYVHPQWQQQLKTVVNIHSSVYGTCQQQLVTGTAEKPWRDRLNLPLLYRYEQRYCSKFNRIVATTEDDRVQLQALTGTHSPTHAPANPQAQIQVIPNGVDLQTFPYRSGDPGGHRLIFVGAMDNLPNVDAARFLTLEVLPAIQEKYPDATLALVGLAPLQRCKLWPSGLE